MNYPVNARTIWIAVFNEDGSLSDYQIYINCHFGFKLDFMAGQYLRVPHEVLRS